MKNYEHYRSEAEHILQNCKNNTLYTESELFEMYMFARVVIEKVINLNGTLHKTMVPFLKEGKLSYEEKECVVKIKELKIGHNDFHIFFEDDYVSKRILKDIFDDWKSDKDEDGNTKSKTISRYYGNGYSTALIIPYEYEQSI